MIIKIFGYEEKSRKKFIKETIGEQAMLEKMKAIIAEQLDIEESQIEETTNFKEDLGVDSLDLFELVMALEEEYDVEIPSEDLEKLLTVGDVMKYLKDKGVQA